MIAVSHNSQFTPRGTIVGVEGGCYHCPKYICIRLMFSVVGDGYG